MRILIIEDEKKVAGFIRRGLKEEGYYVDVAYDGEEGHFLATTNELLVAALLKINAILIKLPGAYRYLS